LLTLRYIPYSKIEHLSSEERINHLLKIIEEESIILLEGRLKKQEEGELIKETMLRISDKFKGIELSVIFPERKYDNLFHKVKKSVINFLLGDRMGMTIIGPATIVKEIKKDPDKIQLFTEELSAELPKKKKKGKR